MGWWFSRKKGDVPEATGSNGKEGLKLSLDVSGNQEVPGMNGAVEVPRPEAVTVFEFGSGASSGDKITLAGYCPVSDELEPCRWEILPSTGSNAPQFRPAEDFESTDRFGVLG